MACAGRSGLAIPGDAGEPPPPAATVGPGDASWAPAWEIPPADLATQRLFRVHYQGPEGEGSLRLTLRLADPDHYRAAAVDVAGRSLWSLSVDGDQGLWLDHRQEIFCSFQGGMELEGLPLGVSLPSLPAVLLGRLPASPAGPSPFSSEGLRPRLPSDRRLEVQDAQGRRWSAPLGEDGSPTAWTLWQEGEPAAWWNRQGDEAILSERRRGVQVRWREVAREPLAGLPAPPVPPASYRPHCGPAVAADLVPPAGPSR